MAHHRRLEDVVLVEGDGDLDEGRGPQPQRRRIEHGAIALDHPGLFQRLHPFPARRFRQPDPLAEVGVGQPPVGLERLQNGEVDPVHSVSQFGGMEKRLAVSRL